MSLRWWESSTNSAKNVHMAITCPHVLSLMIEKLKKVIIRLIPVFFAFYQRAYHIRFGFAGEQPPKIEATHVHRTTVSLPPLSTYITGKALIVVVCIDLLLLLLYGRPSAALLLVSEYIVCKGNDASRNRHCFCSASG